MEKSYGEMIICIIILGLNRNIQLLAESTPKGRRGYKRSAKKFGSGRTKSDLKI